MPIAGGRLDFNPRKYAGKWGGSVAYHADRPVEGIEMSKELRFLGHSDDIFEAAGDEYYDPFVVCVTGGNGAMIVRAFYGEVDHNQGVWCIGIEPVDEDTAIPDWPVRFESASTYSPVLIITAPDDATVEQVAPQ